MSKHGLVLEYMGKSSSNEYPHLIKYPDGSFGTRIDDGHVYRNNRMDCDHDVVGIISPNVETALDSETQLTNVIGNSSRRTELN